MKKLFLILLLGSITVVGLWSCKKNFFDATNVDGSINDGAAFRANRFRYGA
jgi:hypothetical protein